MKMYLISDNVDTYTGMRLAGVDGVAVRHRDDIVQREVDIRELAVQRGYGVEVLIGVLVAPHIQGAVVHQDGRGLIAAGNLLDVGGIDGAVEELVRLGSDVGVHRRVKVAVLAELVCAPGVDLAVLADSNDVIDTGSDPGNLLILNLFRDIGDVNARRAEARCAPDIDLARVGKADGEAAVAVDHLDVVLQLARDGEHGHRGRQVGLRDFGIGVGIGRHEQRADEDQQEHGDDHAEGADGELALHKAANDLLDRADNLFDVVFGCALGLDIIGQALAAAKEEAAEPAALRGGILLAHALTPLLVDSDARVDQAIDNVDDKVAEQRDDDIEQLHQDRNIVVRGTQGRDHELAHAVETEHVFKDQGARKDAGEPADDHRDDGDQGVAPCVRIDNGLFLDALGARGTDAVHGQSIDHGGTDVARHAAQRAERHGDEREGQIVHAVGEPLEALVAAARCLHAAGREPAEQSAEDPDKQNTDNEARQAVADDGKDLCEAVEFAVFAHGAGDTKRNGDGQRQNRGEDVDEDRVLHRSGDNVNYIFFVLIGIAEVALQEAIELAFLASVGVIRIGIQADPAQIAEDHVVGFGAVADLIHFVPFLEPLGLCLGGHTGELLLHGDLIGLRIGIGAVARGQVVDHENHDRQDEQNQEHVADSLENVFEHKVLSSLSPARQ